MLQNERKYVCRPRGEGSCQTRAVRDRVEVHRGTARDAPVKLALSSSPAVPILPLRGFQPIVSNACESHGRSPHGWRNLCPKTREEGARCELYLRPSRPHPFLSWCLFLFIAPRPRVSAFCLSAPSCAFQKSQQAMSVRRCPLASCSALALALAHERPCR